MDGDTSGSCSFTRWLFLVPGLLLAGAGALAAALIYADPVSMGHVQFDAGTLAVACGALIVGAQLVAFACFTKTFAIAEGLLPPDEKFARIFQWFSLEKGLIVGLFVLLGGAGLLAWAVFLWQQAGFGAMPYAQNLRRIIAATTLIVLGLQIIGSSFFMSVLGLKTTSRKPPQP